MPEAFDPYYRWLGIPSVQQPPDYYRLLGVERFEPDPEVIRDAAERQMSHIRRYQLGPHATFSQAILNDLAAARACLLEPGRKAEYDRTLRETAPASAPLAQPGSHEGAARASIWAGRALVGVGLLLVIFARGCDGLSERAAARANARLDLFEARVQATLPQGAGAEDEALALDNAAPPAVSARQQGVIQPADDQDTFSFQAPQSGHLQIGMQASDSSLDCYLRVYDNQQQLLMANDDGGTGKDSLLSLDVEQGRTYYIQAASNSNATAGPYTLTLEIREAEDDFGNDFSQAHAISVTGDEDAESDEPPLDPAEWKNLRLASHEAAVAQADSSYRSQWLLMLGTLCLVAGLLCLAFTIRGPESWISLAMVAVILFTLFAGVGWVGDLLPPSD